MSYAELLEQIKNLNAELNAMRSNAEDINPDVASAIEQAQDFLFEANLLMNGRLSNVERSYSEAVING